MNRRHFLQGTVLGAVGVAASTALVQLASAKEVEILATATRVGLSTLDEVPLMPSTVGQLVYMPNAQGEFCPIGMIEEITIAHDIEAATLRGDMYGSYLPGRYRVDIRVIGLPNALASGSSGLKVR